MPYSVITFMGDSSSGIGALGINAKAFVIQLLTFLIVFLVLRRYAFKPILRILNDRRQLIENGVKLGQDMQKKRDQLEAEIATELHKARDEADKIISDAQQAARRALEESEKQAQSKADSIVAEADERIQQNTARVRKGLEKDMIEWVSEATETLIGEKVDAKKDAVLIDKALKSRLNA